MNKFFIFNRRGISRTILKSLILSLSLMVLTGSFLSSCKNTEQTVTQIDMRFSQFISAFTGNSIDPKGDIVIELTQSMPAIELNQEITEEVFSFSPALKGKAYWINDRTIKFQPEEGALQRGKQYNILFHLGKLMKVPSEFQDFRFSVQVKQQGFHANFFSFYPINRNHLEKNIIQGRIKLGFSEKVEDIAKMFHVKNSKQKNEITVKPLENNEYEVLISGVERTDHAQTFIIEVNGEPINCKRKEEIKFNMPPIIKETQENSIISYEVLENGMNPTIILTCAKPINQSRDIISYISFSGAQSSNVHLNINQIIINVNQGSRSFSLTIEKGLLDQDQMPLNKKYSYSIKILPEKPSVKFINDGNILPDEKNMLLPFSAVGVWAVDVKVYKIFEENVKYYFQDSRSNSYNIDSELRRFGRILMKKQVRLDGDPEKDLSKWNNYTLDLSSVIEKDPGALYIVQLFMKKEYSLYGKSQGEITQISNKQLNSLQSDEISSEEEEEWDVTNAYYTGIPDRSWWNNDDPTADNYYTEYTRCPKSLIYKSNIGIIAKSTGYDQLFLSTSDILNSEPISVNYTIYNFQMQTIAEGQTDNNGFAEANCKGQKPFLVTMQKGNDKAFLCVENGQALSTKDFDIKGVTTRKGLKGYLYGERDVWRPGDTLHLTFILEDHERKIPKDYPIQLELVTPEMQSYKVFTTQNSFNGFYRFDVPTNVNDQTGVWGANITVGNVTFKNHVRIESIKPNRLKINLNGISTPIIGSNKNFTANLHAQWLHGAAAANLKYNIKMQLRAIANPFGEYSQYKFDNPLSSFTSTTQELAEGKLNGNGDASIIVPNPKVELAPSILQAYISTEVMEPGGDISYKTIVTQYAPYSRYVGIKLTNEEEHFHPSDKPITFDLVTLNELGQSIAVDNLSCTVYDVDWSWWWNEDSENIQSYINNSSHQPIFKENFATKQGVNKFSFTPPVDGWKYYFIYIKDKVSGHGTGLTFATSSREYARDSNLGKMPEIIGLTSDKQNYQVGETAIITIPECKHGKALVTVERNNKILSKEWVKTAGEATKYRLKITEEMTPNIYVAVHLLQPYSKNENDHPLRMYGIINLNTENPETKLYPVISMVDELRSEDNFEIKVSEKSKKKMTYTLAIVDEGLLDITNFKTPNPWTRFYSKEALNINTWDMYQLIMGRNNGYFGVPISIGGDMEIKKDNKQTNRFKPIVIFDGPFTVEKGKTNTHKFYMPQYVGSTRVMVIAGNDGAYGSAEKTVPVRNPIMTLSTLPRILGPNEDVMLPVNIFIADKKIKNLTVEVTTTGLLKGIDNLKQSISLNNNSDTTIFIPMKTDKYLGVEQVQIKTTGGGKTTTETIEIEVRNPNPYTYELTSALVNTQKKQSITLATEGLEDAKWIKMEVSRMPNVNFQQNLDYLLTYPHGCSEQITSQSFPLLFISDFMQVDTATMNKYSEKIRSTISMIAARQMPSGGIRYWPSNDYESDWVTNYAGHFLIMAQKKGYKVPSNVITSWRKYQQARAKSWEKDLMVAKRNGGYYVMDDLQQAYRLYTLALDGHANVSAMTRLHDKKNLSDQAKWRLSAAYSLIGRKEIAEKLLFEPKIDIEEYSPYNDTYGSPQRDIAMLLESFVYLKDFDRAIQTAEKLAEMVKDDYLTTQTAAYTLIALGQLSDALGKGDMKFKYSINGEFVSEVSLNEQPLFVREIKPANPVKIEIENTGETKLYASMTALYQPVGYVASRNNNSSLSLDVKYLDKNNQPISVTQLSQGQEFTAIVSVTNNGMEYLTDLVLNETLPSGWEIINERLLGTNSGRNIGETYRDIRDDKVLIYFDLSSGSQKVFKVKLHAAYQGRFYLPGVSCQAMYNPREQAHSQGRWVEIIK